VKRTTWTLQLKRASGDGERTFTGTATHAAEDRMGDIIEPRGARFKLPISLLWAHDVRNPVGWVERATIKNDGIEVQCRIAKVDEPGPLKDACDSAWTAVRMGLVRSLSIGFIVLKAEPLKRGGLRITEWDWAELSLVTVPAQPLATIDSVKERTERARRSARHEAGHAVVAHVLGRGVDRVTIDPGSTHYGPRPASPRVRIMCSVAGGLAGGSAMSVKDRENVQKALPPGTRNADAFIAGLADRTKGILHKYAGAVDAVADALASRKTLFGFEVAELMRKFGQPQKWEVRQWSKGERLQLGRLVYRAKRDTRHPPWRTLDPWERVA
jgi:HK97 family phage prohead protease